MTTFSWSESGAFSAETPTGREWGGALRSLLGLQSVGFWAADLLGVRCI